MRPLELALKYMEIFYSGRNLDEMSDLLAEDLAFSGPFREYHTAEAYVQSLKSSPPKAMEYRIIGSYESSSSACLVYEFSKPGISVPMAQMFEVKGDRISRILIMRGVELNPASLTKAVCLRQGAPVRDRPQPQICQASGGQYAPAPNPSAGLAKAHTCQVAPAPVRDR